MLYLTLGEFLQERKRIEDIIAFKTGSKDSLIFFNIILQLIESKDDTMCYLSLNLLQQYMQTQRLSSSQMVHINKSIFSRLKSPPHVRLGTLKKILHIQLSLIESGADKTQFLHYTDGLISSIRLKIQKDVNYTVRFRESLKEILQEDYLAKIKPELLEFKELFNWSSLGEEVSMNENLPLDLKFHLSSNERILLFVKRLGLVYLIEQKLSSLTPLKKFFEFPFKLDKNYCQARAGDSISIQLKNSPFALYFKGKSSKLKSTLYFMGLGISFFVLKKIP